MLWNELTIMKPNSTNLPALPPAPRTQHLSGLVDTCHLVIRDNGLVGRARWGEEGKRGLLAWKGAMVESEGRGDAGPDRRPIQCGAS